MKPAVRPAREERGSFESRDPVRASPTSPGSHSPSA